MKKLLIIKAGTTYPAIRSVAGDFDDMIIDRSGIPREDVVICPVYEGQKLPGLSGIFAVIITGSHAMVTDRADWSVELGKWIREKAFNAVPIMGICYAHQLIAMALGGGAGYHDRGIELGTTAVSLTQEGMRDPLMKDLPQEFKVHVSHAQTVTMLPPGARVLAYNAFEKHHAVAVGKMTWGLQFHPEFNAETVNMYIEQGREGLARKGYDIQALHKTVSDNQYGEVILKRFIELAQKQM